MPLGVKKGGNISESKLADSLNILGFFEGEALLSDYSVFAARCQEFCEGEFLLFPQQRDLFQRSPSVVLGSTSELNFSRSSGPYPPTISSIN